MSIGSENESDSFGVSDSGSDDFGSGLKKKLANKSSAPAKVVPASKPAKKLNKVDDLKDSRLPPKKVQDANPPIKKTTAVKKKVISQSSDVDEKPATKKAKNVLESSDSEFDPDDVQPVNPRGGNA